LILIYLHFLLRFMLMKKNLIWSIASFLFSWKLFSRDYYKRIYTMHILLDYRSIIKSSFSALNIRIWFFLLNIHSFFYWYLKYKLKYQIESSLGNEPINLQIVRVIIIVLLHLLSLLWCWVKRMTCNWERLYFSNLIFVLRNQRWASQMFYQFKSKLNLNNSFRCSIFHYKITISKLSSKIFSLITNWIHPVQKPTKIFEEQIIGKCIDQYNLKKKWFIH